LPFNNAFAPTGIGDAASMHACYRALLAQAGIHGMAHAEGERQSAPYNLLVTRDWMLLVPRSRDAFEGVSINSLAYAGALFVREPHQLEAVRKVGPMAVLTQVGRR
jgi:ATP adenylyltransferase